MSNRKYKDILEEGFQQAKTVDECVDFIATLFATTVDSREYFKKGLKRAFQLAKEENGKLDTN